MMLTKLFFLKNMRSNQKDECMSKKPPQPLFKKPFFPQSGIGFAFRVGTEFTSGILVGLVIGYAVDQILGTQPWGIVVMVILGAAAGMLNIFRILGLWGPQDAKTLSSQKKEKDG
jgi:F0F1-type ATP synthase assembly protein I